MRKAVAESVREGWDLRIDVNTKCFDTHTAYEAKHCDGDKVTGTAQPGAKGAPILISNLYHPGRSSPKNSSTPLTAKSNVGRVLSKKSSMLSYTTKSTSFQ